MMSATRTARFMVRVSTQVGAFLLILAPGAGPVAAGTPIPETSLDSCARPDFWRGVCDVFIDVQHAGNTGLREHEEKRCRGYDYRDSDALAGALRAWRDHGENRYADMLDFEAMMFVWEPLK